MPCRTRSVPPATEREGRCRKAAIENLNLETVKRKLADEGIYLRNGSDSGLLEEAPDAYKDVNEIIEVVCNAGLTGKVAKLTPIGVVKG